MAGATGSGMETSNSYLETMWARDVGEFACKLGDAMGALSVGNLHNDLCFEWFKAVGQAYSSARWSTRAVMTHRAVYAEAYRVLHAVALEGRAS